MCLPVCCLWDKLLLKCIYLFSLPFRNMLRLVLISGTVIAPFSILDILLHFYSVIVNITQMI